MSLTDWYDPKQKPTKIGVYQRDHDGRLWYSYWNGSYWGMTSAFADFAFQYRLQKSAYQEMPWRGLQRNPE